MNDPLPLPPRRQLTRPSPELGRRMEALFASAAARPRAARVRRGPWLAFLAPAGLAAAVALYRSPPWLTGPRQPQDGPTETRELPADLAATLFPCAPAELEFSLSLRSY